jgi:arylsulfatase A-like enzyme
MREDGPFGPRAFTATFPEMNQREVGTRPLPPELHPSWFVAESAAEFFAREHATSPCLALVSFVDPHHPWDPPAEIAAHYPASEMPLPDHAETGALAWPLSISSRLSGAHLGPGDDRPEVVRTVTAYYYAMIEMIDRAVGRVVDAVEWAGQIENTVFAFCSDHGEFLGSYGLYRKPSMHYDCLIRIPCFLSGPGVTSAGRRCAGLVEEVDLAPTLYEVLGIPAPAGLQGRSLAPALRGEAFAGRESVYVQSIHCRDGGPFSNCLTVRTAEAKLNCYPGEGVAHLFDLLEDPAERRDLYADPGTSQLREAMTSLLIERLHGQRDPLPTPLSQF